MSADHPRHGSHIEEPAFGDVVRAVVSCLADTRPPAVGSAGSGRVVVGIGGPVAVGKTVLATRLAAAITASTGDRVAVVGADGFLHPNAVLVARGMLDRKGFPESYDWEAMRSFLVRARAGETGLVVPQYSHELYDVLPDGERLGDPDVVVVEGVSILQVPVVAHVDVRVYLDAAPADLESWFVHRLVAMVDALPADSTSVLSMFRGLAPTELTAAASEVWHTYDVPINARHVEATRAEADIVVGKGPDHDVRAIEVRADRRPTH